jgi:hypothetical protein
MLGYIKVGRKAGREGREAETKPCNNGRNTGRKEKLRKNANASGKGGQSGKRKVGRQGRKTRRLKKSGS